MDEKKNSSDVRGARRTLTKRLMRVMLTVSIIVLATGITYGAYGLLATRASQASGPPPAPVTVVAPSVLELQDSVTILRRFTGQFEAAQETALAFEEGGTIAEVSVREGDRVARGDVLARLDTRLLEAERNRLDAARRALEAQAELARRTNARQETLLSEGHVTAQRVDETSLRLAQLEASVAEIDVAILSVDIRLSKAEITAPFNGRIRDRFLDVGAVAGPGAPVLTLLEDAPTRFRVALDPYLARGLAPGNELEIETGGRRLTATFTELSPDIDPATRARVAYLDVPAIADEPPAGSSGTVVVPDTIEREGAWVPLSALRHGPRGAWTLLTVSVEDVVGVEAAEILQVDADRAFVRGTFQDGVAYLADGTHRVVPGERVRRVEAE